MKNLESITAIIPSGGSDKQDLKRAKLSINKHGENSNYIISGSGPDTNLGLGYEKSNKENLDYHKNLYEFVMKNTKSYVGLDIKSTTTKENLIETFPLGQSGEYIWTSYFLHNIKTKKLIKNLQKQNKISKDINVKFINTGYSFKEIFNGDFAKETIYGLAALAELYLKKIPFKNNIKKKFAG